MLLTRINIAWPILSSLPTASMYMTRISSTIGYMFWNKTWYSSFCFSSRGKGLPRELDENDENERVRAGGDMVEGLRRLGDNDEVERQPSLRGILVRGGRGAHYAEILLVATVWAPNHGVPRMASWPGCNLGYLCNAVAPSTVTTNCGGSMIGTVCGTC